MIRLAPISTGTPASESCRYQLQPATALPNPRQHQHDQTGAGLTTIISPDDTSFTVSASSAKPSVEKYRSHRRTGGMLLRLTKNPAYVMRNRLARDDRRMATPPCRKTQARRKFCCLS